MAFHWAKVVQKQSVHSRHCHYALENKHIKQMGKQTGDRY